MSSPPGADHDRRLLSYVQPPDWANPRPAPIYDMVVVGGGTAGLVCAAGAAGLGARVALVERGRLGGDCLNTGCVPSKALLRAARVVHEARAGATVGVDATTTVDFGAVMAHVRASRVAIAPHDSAERFSSLGVDVFFGDAAFSSRRTIAVGGSALTFRRAVIATGAEPRVPAIPGLGASGYLTSETLFSLTDQPASLLIIGGGPIGCEMAQAFALLGTSVTLVETAPRVLPREDPDASAAVARHLTRAGVTIHVGSTLERIRESDDGVSAMLGETTVAASAVLVATGRVPRLAGLNLDAAGIAVEEGRLVVDDRLRTSNPRVFSAGDVSSTYQFTHAADALARIVVQNALFFGRRRASDLVIPRCIFTFPEVAHVGAGAGGDPPAAQITVSLDDLDRAVVDDETDGFIRVRHRHGRIIGATIVAPHAAELIGPVAQMIQAGQSLGDLSATVFPYPTVAEGLRRAGDAYRRASLTPFVRGVLERYFSVFRR
jgi:pyruvate/2-oxoglutarate dehydrogenase complex dihydrolipoamide dehydrogenase (E3) component